MRSEVIIRKACPEDLLAVVTLITNGRPEDEASKPLPVELSEGYRNSFAQIMQDQNAYLMVAELEGRVVGTFQLNYLTYLIGNGQDDAQLEGVHVDSQYRGRGIGSQMVDWAIQHATARQCRRLQLTTDKRRKRAHQFYERLGFVASHEGMKRSLPG